MRRLWHDDRRTPPDTTWDWAHTNEEAKELLLANRYEVVSLDHDMGDVPGKTKLAPNGEELAKWLVGHIDLMPEIVRIHSYDILGARRMAKHLEPFTQVVIQPFDPRWSETLTPPRRCDILSDNSIKEV